MSRSDNRPIVFLFLGETLLIPHLYPILESLARLAPEAAIEAWVATETHETLVGRWITAAGLDRVQICRVPGWLNTENPGLGINPPLPPKLPLLMRLVPRLMGARAVICAEQTSLWIPRVLGWLPNLPPFIQTLHGAGTINSGRSGLRRDAAALIMVASEQERANYIAHGTDPARITVTGYVKAGFRQLATTTPCFAADRPIVLYNPHWQRHRSSWWEWGAEAIDRILTSGRYNLIFAPHQRLVEGAPEIRSIASGLAGRDDAIGDIESFAAVDGSYLRAADIYLGDTSSQVLEFLREPRPAVFLDPLGRDWRAEPTLSLWACGEVVTSLDDLLPTLDGALKSQASLAAFQAEFVAKQVGAVNGFGPDHAARAVLDFIAAEATR